LVHLQPRVTVPALCATDHSFGDPALAFFSLEQLQASILIPVKQTSQGCFFEQATVPGWDRLVRPSVDPAANSEALIPVLVSARDAWDKAAAELHVFDRGYVIDGASRLEAAARRDRLGHFPVIAVFGLDERQELALRAHLRAPDATNKIIEPAARFDTDTPRLEVHDKWVRFTVESDPFVVPTARGYAPAILVRRPTAKQREHLLIGAASLAKPLETIRLREGSLKGRSITIRKDGPDKTATYTVRDEG
jgi:hypothetical protein